MKLNILQGIFFFNLEEKFYNNFQFYSALSIKLCMHKRKVGLPWWCSG